MSRKLHQDFVRKAALEAKVIFEKADGQQWSLFKKNIERYYINRYGSVSQASYDSPFFMLTKTFTWFSTEQGHEYWGEFKEKVMGKGWP